MAIIRKKTGHFLEDFRVGQVFRHKRGKTITSGLFNTFSEFTMTTNPLAKNARYARAYGFRDLVAPPGLVMNVAFSQTVEDVSENARANLEYIGMRFGKAVVVGDTIEVETTVLGVKPSSKDADRGVVHVRSTGRNQDGAVVITFERKVQVWKGDQAARVDDGEIPSPVIDCSLDLPPYDTTRDYRSLAHLSAADGYFEDLAPGDTIEHSRGRTITTEHIALTAQLDNTSQVHCNQFLIDQNPAKYIGGQLIVYGGIAFNVFLGLSSPDVGENSLGDVEYRTGRHTGPVFAGDTLFASTEIRAKRDFPARADLGIVDTVLRGFKPVKKNGAWERVEVFYLERAITLKRRAYYT
ncbi:MAG TPA: MaoC family dehydratase [Candidatus Binatia bacterium]|nr:MaoC family dehydratase [Candidatus Binatia bacterium]